MIKYCRIVDQLQSYVIKDKLLYFKLSQHYINREIITTIHLNKDGNNYCLYNSSTNVNITNDDELLNSALKI